MCGLIGWQLNGISMLGRDSKLQAHTHAMPIKLKLSIPHTERFVSRAQAQIETVYGFLPMLSSEASRESTHCYNRLAKHFLDPWR
jgi:hypothetical protein